MFKHSSNRVVFEGVAHDGIVAAQILSSARSAETFLRSKVSNVMRRPLETSDVVRFSETRLTSDDGLFVRGGDEQETLAAFRCASFEVLEAIWDNPGDAIYDEIYED